MLWTIVYRERRSCSFCFMRASCVHVVSNVKYNEYGVSVLLC